MSGMDEVFLILSWRNQIFSKFTNCIVGPNDNIEVPKNSNHTDWEVEIGFVIGKKAKYVEEKNALDYVLGFFLVTDVSEREFQKNKGLTWDKGKGFDTFGPIGPYILTKDEVKDYDNLNMLSLIHIWRCRRSTLCRSRWSPYH